MKNVRARKRTRTRQQGFDDVQDFHEIEGHQEVTPADEVEAVLERYAGRPVPIADVYPEPPRPLTGNRALDYRGAAPRNPDIIVQDPVQPRIASEEAYRKEHQLKLVHRFIMRGASMQQVSTALGIELFAAYQLRTELFKRISAEASAIDFPLYVGMSMGFYNEIKAISMRNADTATRAAPDEQGRMPETITHKARIAYLALAKAAEDSQHRLLQVSGFFDNVKLTPAEMKGDDAVSEMDDMHKMMRMMMDPVAFGSSLEEALSDGAEEIFGPEEGEKDYIKVI